MARTPNQLNDDPVAIRHEIAHTRAQMSQTLDKIQHRVSPAHLRHQAEDAIKEATLEKVEDMKYGMKRQARSLRQTMRENPTPLALIGLGVGWLLMSGDDDEQNNDDFYDYNYYPGDLRTSNRRQSQDPSLADQARWRWEQAQVRAQRTAGNAQEAVSDYAGNVQDRLQTRANQAQNRAENMADQAQTTMSNMQDQAQEYAGNLQDQVQAQWQQTQEYASDLQDQAQAQWQQTRLTTRRQARRAKRGFMQTLDENPLAVGLAALAVGTIVGLSLPATEMEDEWMGETRDQFMSQAQDVAQDTFQRAQVVAEETTQTLQEEAQRVATKATRVAKVEAEKMKREVKQTAETEAKKQDLT